METVRGEPVIRKTEVIHYPACDILLNTAVPNIADVRNLAAQLSDGFPKTWKRLPKNENIFLDNPSAPKYVGKKRKYVSPHAIKELHRDKLAIPQYFRSMQHAYNTIANEIVLSSEIDHIVSSSEAQEIAKANGFADITYIMPLLGIVEKASQAKSMIYPFVEGESYELKKETVDGPFKSLSTSTLVPSLRALFHRAIINPTDLGVSQFMIHTNETGQHLYLLDTEGYFKDKELARQQEAAIGKAS
jgi:hypothetical protein